MQGRAPPWYPLQGNPSAGNTWESYPPLYRVLIPRAHPPEGYPNDVYPPPQPQFSELHFSHEALVVNYPPERYSNNVYPPPEGYSNNVYPPPQQQLRELHFSPPVRYPNNVYPPPPQQLNELHFYEGMMNGRWYGQQGYPQWCPPQGYPRQGYPQYGGLAQEEYSNNAYGYPPQGYNNLYAQPPQGMNHRPQNTYTQIGGGQNNPQIQGVGKIANKGDLNMGYSSGATNNFNNQGSYAEKQIQGVNGGSVQM